MFSDLIDFNDLSFSDRESIFTLAHDICGNPAEYGDRCRGKILASLFYEPSTRTSFSFQSAMLRLGGNVIGFSDSSSSSVIKGESLKDTVKIVSNYADVIVMRHHYEGAAYAASLYSPIPVINAGDGGHLHPTQTMTDLFTIGKLKNKSMQRLTIGICGDLFYGRTVHSLIKAFSLYSENVFYFISTPELKVPEYYTRELTKNGNKVFILNTIEECIEKLDIIYMTRIQRERFTDENEYIKQAGIYILDKNKLAKAKPDLAILHPLPKNDEITPDIDEDRRALYFKQAELGMYVRMALLVKILEKAKPPKNIDGIINKKCENINCIVNNEHGLPNMAKSSGGNTYCAYCEIEVI